MRPHVLLYLCAFAPALAAADESRARRLYEGACAPCHGDRGDGNGPAARALDPRPRDFTAAIYEFRSTESGSLPLVEDVERTVREGVPGTAMPAWRDHLDERDIRLVAAYVLAFAARPPKAPPERIVPSTIAPPPVTPALLARGARIYVDMSCGKCHGPSGRGDGPAAPTLQDDAGRSLPPLDFTRGFYKGGRRPLDVYRTFVTGLSGTPMPSYADALADEDDRSALVHYVRSLSVRETFASWLFGRFTAWE